MNLKEKTQSNFFKRNFGNQYILISFWSTYKAKFVFAQNGMK